MSTNKNFVILLLATTLIGVVVYDFYRPVTATVYACYFGAPDPWISAGTMYEYMNRNYGPNDKYYVFNLTCYKQEQNNSCIGPYKKNYYTTMSIDSFNPVVTAAQ